MPIESHAQTAILYEHALLGEGIARYLRDSVGVSTSTACVFDADDVRRVLADDPRVVIFERGGVLAGEDLHALAPHAAIIDVSAAVCHGTPTGEPPVDLDTVVVAVLAGCAGSDDSTATVQSRPGPPGGSER